VDHSSLTQSFYRQTYLSVNGGAICHAQKMLTKDMQVRMSFVIISPRRCAFGWLIPFPNWKIGSDLEVRR